MKIACEIPNVFGVVMIFADPRSVALNAELLFQWRKKDN